MHFVFVAFWALGSAVRADDLSECVAFEGVGWFVDAARLYRKAAARNDTRSFDAMTRLARLYMVGSGTPQDFAEAARLYGIAAEMGIVEAQYQYGDLHAEGRGVTKSSAVAALWWEKAATSPTSHPQASQKLGSLYRFGDGVPRDLDKATYFDRLPAEMGDLDTQLRLGLAYQMDTWMYGPMDLKQAHMWLNIVAARAGKSRDVTRFAATLTRDSIARKLTPADLAEAQKMATDWMTRHEDRARR